MFYFYKKIPLELLMLTPVNDEVFFALKQDKKCSVFSMPTQDLINFDELSYLPKLELNYKDFPNCTGIMPSCFWEDKLWVIYWQHEKDKLYAPKIGSYNLKNNEMQLYNSLREALFCSSPYQETINRLWVIEGVEEKLHHGNKDALYSLTLLESPNGETEFALNDMTIICKIFDEHYSFGRITKTTINNEEVYIFCGRELHKRNKFNNAIYKLFYLKKEELKKETNFHDIKELVLDYEDKSLYSMEAYPQIIKYKDKNFLIFNSDKSTYIYEQE